MSFKFHRGALFAISVVSMGSLGAVELERADLASKLASDDPELRRQAEVEILEAGDQAVEWLEALQKHEDPWLAMRASRLLLERIGIDPGLPLETQKKLADFKHLEPERRAGLLKTLSQEGEGNLEVVIELIEHQPQEEPLPADLLSALTSAVSFRTEQVFLLDPGSLHPRTLAALISSVVDRQSQPKAALYARWRKLKPAIRDHLFSRDLALEFEYLGDADDTLPWFHWIARIVDPVIRARVISEMERTMERELPVPKDLDEDAALGCVLVFNGSRGSHRAFQIYEDLVKRFPGLSKRLPEELRMLEVLRLEKAGELAEALRLACSADPENRAVMDWLRRLGKALEDEPERLDAGLPVVPEPRSERMMAAFLKGFFSMDRPRPGFGDVDDKVAVFDGWARSPEWLEAAWLEGPVPLYQLTMIRRGQWRELMLRHENATNRDPLMILGALIALRPPLRDALPAEICDPQTLRPILVGALEACPYSPFSTLEIADLAETWTELHPDLVAEGSMSAEPLLRAIGIWRQGDSNAASAMLLSWIFPAPENELPSQDARKRSDLALFVLTDLLGSAPELNSETILNDDRFTKEMFEKMFRRLTEAGTNSIGRTKGALVVAKLLREKHGVVDTKLHFTSTDADAMILESWLRADGDGERVAGDFLIAALIGGKDPEFREDGRHAALIGLLARSDEALEALEDAKTFISEEDYRTKKAWLLRNLGRTEEAQQVIGNHGDPSLRLALALENRDWVAAERSIYGLKPESRRDLRRAVLAALSGESALLGRVGVDRYSEAKLVLGTAESPEELAAMAGHPQLAAGLEKELIDALAAGRPVSSRSLWAYVEDLDLLSNPQATVLLLTEIGRSDHCDKIGEAKNRVKHKIMAAAALLRLGRGDLAFEILQPHLAAGELPRDFEMWQQSFWGGDGRAFVSGLAVFLRLAEVEWPERDVAGRVTALAAILSQRDVDMRAADSIELIGKHAELLSQEDLLSALFVPLIDRGRSGEIPPSLGKRARDLLERHEAGESERQALETWLAGYRWQSHSSFAPENGPLQISFSCKPSVGTESDPKAKNFEIIDGISQVAELADDDEVAARDLLRDIMIRVLLDDRLMSEVEWRFVKRRKGYSFSSGFDTRGPETLLVALDAFKVPPALAASVADDASITSTGYADIDRSRRAGELLAAAGRHREALVPFQRFIILSSGTDREALLGMHRSRGLAAIEEGNLEHAVDSLRMLLIFAPFSPHEAVDLIAAVQSSADDDALSSARKAVEQFWRARQLEMPESGTYDYWSSEWEKLLSP
ncbi:hypothetical protein ACFQY0_11000 [Haloferula chungangensis]|uniref:Tetratricopeptide repeat protein n=1 Tax=Haloferula chungangensis TaxID=1048331 RepID=A0ABW2L884_9BACT